MKSLTPEMIQKTIREGSSEEMQVLLRRKWPEEAFTKTKVLEEALRLKFPNLALIMEKEENLTAGPLNHFVERFPELRAMALPEHHATSLTQASASMVGGKVEVRKSSVFKVKLNFTSDRDVWTALSRLATACESHQVAEVDVLRVKKVEIFRLRKIDERALQGMDVIITLIPARP